MGSYDTGEYDYRPRRRISEGSGSSNSSSSGSSSSSSSSSGSSRRTTSSSSSSNANQGGTQNAPAVNRPAPQTNYDASLPTIAALGGGLSPARIVKELPVDVKEKSIKDVIDYLMSAEVVSTKEETRIVTEIQRRQGQNNYRVVVNNFHNLYNSKLPTEIVTAHYQKKERRTSSGNKSINFIDMAIISHDEGGKDSAYNLEKRCE